MTNHPNRGRVKRPLHHLNQVAQDYPEAWRQIDIFRNDKGKDLPDWPSWCFLPMAAWYSIVSAELQVERIALPMIIDVARLAALGAWRYTQSIYRLDPELYKAVSNTVLSGELPVDLLLRLPEWSVYIETPGGVWHDDVAYGFFAHLEYDVNRKANELRLLIDTETNLIPVPIHIGPWTITEAVDRALDESKKQANASDHDMQLPDNFIEIHSAMIYPLVSLLLYVCSNGVEYSDDEIRPSNPQPKRTKKGWKLFPAQKPRIWNLGKKTGDAIRNHMISEKTRKGPAPHIRRAHWHSYWVGSKDAERTLDVKFMPPIPVAMYDEK